MLTILERSKGNVIGVESSGTITLEEQQKAEEVFDKAIKEHGKINWLYVFRSMKYESLRPMYEDMMWCLKNLKNFDRMAVVGDKKWQELLIKADGLVFGEKYFDISQLDEAWAYVEGTKG